MIRGRAYRRLRFRLDAAREELLAAELWELGTLGLESRAGADGTLLATAYFPLAIDAGELTARTAAWRERGIELLGADELPERDWLAEYRRRARPFALGAGFWADPREPTGEAAPPGRRLLRLPARQAFGTGSHASTRLAVELLEERPPAGRSLLDVGAGTGVLSLVGLHLGAAPVVAVERDPVAAIQAAQILALNDSAVALIGGGPEALGETRFQLVVVNMTLASLRAVLPQLPRLAARDGEVLVSGSLADQEEELAGRLAAAGLEPSAARRRDGWVALRARPRTP